MLTIHAYDPPCHEKVTAFSSLILGTSPWLEQAEEEAFDRHTSFLENGDRKK